MGKWSNRLKFPPNPTHTTLSPTHTRNKTTGPTTQTMVAISLYRGNMHRVPSEPPRRWLMPTPKITLKDFRTLLHRRSKALSLLPSSSSVTNAAVVRNPNPPEKQEAVAGNPNLMTAVETTVVASSTDVTNPNTAAKQEAVAGNADLVTVADDSDAAAIASTSVAAVTNPNPLVKQEALAGNPNLTTTEVPMELNTVADEIKVEGDNTNVNGDDLGAMALDLVVSLNLEEKEKEKEERVVAAMVECVEKKVNGNGLVVEIPVFEGDKLDNADDKEKRKKEVEEKLKVLNEKKHNLVQALRQILNAEEELKQRSCMQAGRPPLPTQTDASNDSGSMTRHATPRTGSEPNITVDVEGEGNDALNHNPQSRPLLHMSSTSPSAESALRRPPYFHHNVASHPSRASVVVAGSPSRFAPTGNQGQPSNLPSVSVSGTNYVASSPSPAASGGTSGLRDARHPSPWN